MLQMAVTLRLLDEHGKEYLPSSDHRKKNRTIRVVKHNWLWPGMLSGTIHPAPVSIHISVLSHSKSGKCTEIQFIWLILELFAGYPRKSSIAKLNPSTRLWEFYEICGNQPFWGCKLLNEESCGVPLWVEFPDYDTVCSVCHCSTIFVASIYMSHA